MKFSLETPIFLQAISYLKDTFIYKGQKKKNRNHLPGYQLYTLERTTKERTWYHRTNAHRHRKSETICRLRKSVTQ